MKHLMSSFLFAATILISSGNQVRADEYEYKSGGRTWKYTVDNGTVKIISVSPRDGENITIPRTINGYPVTVIGNRLGIFGAFSNCDDITSFEVPDFIISIDNDAFSGCDKLTSITISKNVKHIGEGVFAYCKKLKQINVDPDNANFTTENGVLLTKDRKVLITGIRSDVMIPTTVRRIGKQAFIGCKFTNVTIPKSVIEIGEKAFYGCENLTEISIPSSVKTIGEKAFYNCPRLKRFKVDEANLVYASENGLLLSKDKKVLICGVNGNVVIPNTVTVIGSHAFDGCEGWLNSYPLKSVIIPDSVTEIGASAFNSCHGLQDVVIPNSVTRICDGAFSWCKGLTKVTLGADVRSIGKDAFSHCSNLKSVTIPDSVTEIGSDAFSDCEKMTSVRIGKGLKTISRRAFASCGLEKVEIPNNVAKIEGFAFVSCTNLVNVQLNKDVTQVTDTAFKYCSKLGQDEFVTSGNSARRSETKSRALRILDELRGKEIYAKGYVSYELKGRFTNNYDEAFKLFTEASQLGFLPADAMLSYMYGVGEGCKIDETKAFVHAKKAVSCENLDPSNGDYRDASNLARFTLGTLYLVGFTDPNGKRQKDDYKAYDYYCKMVMSMIKEERRGKTSKSCKTLLDRTSLIATFAIALMQYEGRGTSKNAKSAAKILELFTSLDDGGNDIDKKRRGWASMCLGLLYYRGDGVGRNHALAWNHLRNGAALAFPELIRAAKAPITNDDIANYNTYFGHVEISLWTPYSWKMYNLYKGKCRPNVFSLMESDLLKKALMTLFNPDIWVGSGVDYNFDDM